MKKVNLSYLNIAVETAKAYGFAQGKKSDLLWIPKGFIKKFIGKKHAIISDFGANILNIHGVDAVHKPHKIKPEYNQEAIEDVRY